MKHILRNLFILIFCFFVSEIQAQDESRWTTGGNFGVGFSNNTVNILISPQIGYRVFSFLELGVRATYNYYQFSYDSEKFKSHNYGGGAYATAYIFKGLFAHAENEFLSYKYYDERKFVHSVFVGGGYRQYFSERGYISASILYNLNETFDSPYDNPIYRVGIGFGL